MPAADTSAAAADGQALRAEAVQAQTLIAEGARIGTTPAAESAASAAPSGAATTESPFDTAFHAVVSALPLGDSGGGDDILSEFNRACRRVRSRGGHRHYRRPAFSDRGGPSRIPHGRNAVHHLERRRDRAPRGRQRPRSGAASVSQSRISRWGIVHPSSGSRATTTCLYF